MKELYSEGVAHRTGPESWGGTVRYPRKGSSRPSVDRGNCKPEVERRNICPVECRGRFPRPKATSSSQECARLNEFRAVKEPVRAVKPTTRKSRAPVAAQANGCLGRKGKPKGIIQ